ncbi:MAG: hypothetical protein AAB899_02210 [Patescibacteria group bacterium]
MTLRDHDEWARDQHGYGRHTRASKIHHARRQTPADEAGAAQKMRDEEERNKKQKEHRELF